MKNTKSLMFFASILYSMDEKWRGIGTSEAFEDILGCKKNVNLNLAFFRLKEEGLLGEFSEDFRTVQNTRRIQNLGGFVSGLDHYYLIRKDGDKYFYHLDLVDPERLERIIKTNNLPRDLIEKASRRLNEILNELESKTITPTI